MKTFERYVKAVIILLFLLLIIVQWLVTQTNINQYVNPVYDYIGVQKPVTSFP
ncbi:DUF5359 family protein [Salinibacillus xinjiangensis]|uniref:Uncharacterized protein n=1 Tax=Salinibacillus xinjiangensis TaxID=1229268 RepID=A0A6G1X5Z3_9BACI|nr:DUF5359 family protein [Salinibacillus xinjiangensis]MRG86421.1 hypothetical protein [Salinibacillus xinjiangensis]